jgi:C4-dicarboxylate-binding protein DctP
MRIRVRVVIGIMLLASLAEMVGCGGGDGDSPPAGETITLKLVTAGPAAPQRAYEHFATLVEEYTDGRVRVDVYPNGQLFPGTEQWEAMVQGTVDIFADAGYYFRDAVPDILAFYTDGIFESYEHAYAVLEDSGVPAIVAEKAEEAAPVKFLGILPGALSICVLNSIRETANLDDLDGLKCQGFPGAPPQPFYEFTGMASIPMSPEEAPTAFLQGVLDAVHYPPVALESWHLYEKGKHALCRYSLFVVNGIVMNERSWNGLPQDVQDIIVNQVMPETYEVHKAAYREDEEAALDILMENTETFHWLSEEELESYLQYLPTHATYKVQMLMVEPEIVVIIEEMSPSNQ